MAFDLQWLLLAIPLTFAFGWLAARIELRQRRRDASESPRAYFKGLNLLLNEQPDDAIDAFIEAVQHDPETTELHFALGNLFRRRGEFDRAIRVHEHLLARDDLGTADRQRAQSDLARDFMDAGLVDRAEDAWRPLLGTPLDVDARLALLTLHERTRDWPSAIAEGRELSQRGLGDFARRISHYECELAVQAAQAGDAQDADDALARARAADPTAPRPLVMLVQRHEQHEDPRGVVLACDALLQAAPASFALVAEAYARASRQLGRAEVARDVLRQQLQARHALSIVRALAELEPDPVARRALLLSHLQQHPTVSAAQTVLDDMGVAPTPSAAATAPRPVAAPDQGTAPPDAGERTAIAASAEFAAVRAAVDRAVAPNRRYRCAACGFESHLYFWQCPGCLNWDSMPPVPVEEK